MAQVARYTNEMGIAMSMAVWLAQDEYDYVDEENYISATALIKPTRQLVLSGRSIKATGGAIVDVASMIPNRIGTALHNSVEQAWTKNHKDALQKLGIPDSVAKRVVVNPASVKDGDIPIYLEQRVTRELNGFLIGGKFDMVCDGIVEDIKTTQIFSYMSGSNDWKYRLQGSIYRWLNPELITKDFMHINFIFHDWKAHEYRAKKDQGYPKTKVFRHRIKLMSLAETELWIQKKLNELTTMADAPEAELPLCTAQDLWQDAPTFKYYKNPEKRTRSTKNFKTFAEANLRYIQDGSVGAVVEVPGTARACTYCDAFTICTQKDSLIAAGILQV